MFFLRYLISELRRRRGRTILTALGLAVGVGLVIIVNALSTGLSNAQANVLKPLTGVGTDMSVSRPLKVTSDGSGAFGQLSASQRAQLQNEVKTPGVDLGSLSPGSPIDADSFSPTSGLTFPSSEVAALGRIPGVASVAGSLSLTDVHLSGSVPSVKVTQTGGGRRGLLRAIGGLSGGSVTSTSRSVTGVDQTDPSLAAVTPAQIVKGGYFTGASRYQAIVSVGYANAQDLAPGSSISLGGKSFRVVGVSSPPLGSTASDIYVKLGTLQSLAGFGSQVDTAEVRASDASQVPAVSSAISRRFEGSQVTTASDLAARVSGSLTDAQSLSSRLGTALEIVALIAAVLIAGLLTLTSVGKRVREIGTLKAIGWSRLQVVRQICAETLGQGLIGGVVGVAFGVAGVAVINAFGWTLNASVPAAAATGVRGLSGGFFGLGQTGAAAGSTPVQITAVTSIELIAVAVGLAVLGGLLSGAIGGLRAARLRPAAALRNVE